MFTVSCLPVVKHTHERAYTYTHNQFVSGRKTWAVRIRRHRKMNFYYNNKLKKII